EDQLAALRASGSRANLPQIAAVSLLTVRVRDAIALSRAQAVVARGNLEFLQPATRASQVAPSPLVDAFTVFVLTTLAVLAVGLARAGTDRRVHAASGLAEVAGVPMLADLSRAPAPGPASAATPSSVSSRRTSTAPSAREGRCSWRAWPTTPPCSTWPPPSTGSTPRPGPPRA